MVVGAAFARSDPERRELPSIPQSSTRRLSRSARLCRLPAAALIVAVLTIRVSCACSATLWAVTGAVVIDGTGSPPTARGVIVGTGDRITCVGTAATCDIAPGAVIVDATGKWIVPGLIDTHVHVNWSNPPGRNAQLTRFAFGVTTTRDAGAPSIEQSVEARARASASDAPEPRIVASALVSSEAVQRYGVMNYASLVRTFATLGADAIKIKQEFTAQEIHEIVDESHRAGLPVFGHVPQNLAAAVESGVDGLSHMFTLSAFGLREEAIPPAPEPDSLPFFVWFKELWNYQDPERLRAALDMVIKRGSWFEPMLVTERHFTFPYPMPSDASFLGEPRSIDAMIRPWLPVGDTGWIAGSQRRTRLSAVYARMCGVVREFVNRGGVVVTGTDNEVPGVGLTAEVALLAECGLSPMAALRAATQQAARALANPNIGTIETGKLADFVILDRDPLSNLANLRRVWRVVKGGHLHDPAALLAPRKAVYMSRLRTTWTLRAVGFCLIGILAITLGRRFRRRAAA